MHSAALAVLEGFVLPALYQNLGPRLDRLPACLEGIGDTAEQAFTAPQGCNEVPFSVNEGQLTQLLVSPVPMEKSIPT